MSEIATSAGSLHYEIAGEPGAIGPIVLLHGMGMSSTSYADVIPGLAAVTQVIAIDSMGHGKSARPADDEFPTDRFADTVIEAIDALGLGPVNLIGNSLGAMTAVEVGAYAPDRLRSLVLVGCPGWDGRQRTERLKTARDVWRNAANSANPSTAADLAGMFTAPTDELADRVNAARTQSAPFIVQAGMAVMTHDTLGRSFSVSTPTLLICGERDVVLPDQQRFLRAIPGSRLDVFENAGHYPQVDNPARFVESVLGFLREV